MPVRILFLAIAVLTSATASSAAQTADTNQGLLRVDARLVLVDVVVRDDGGPVMDLTVDDFLLFDDGVERLISVFNSPTTDGLGSGTPLPPGTVSNRRDFLGQMTTNVTVILMDRLNTSLQDQIWANHQLREFLASAGPQDRIAVYELSGELKVIQDFTEDPRKLLQNYDLRPRLFVSGHGLNLAAADALSVFLEGNRSLPDVRTASDPLVRQQLAYRARLHNWETTEALKTIARHLADMPGRKNLLWVSGNFPLTYWAFAADRRDAATYAEQVQTSLVLSDANVAVYPMQAQGLTLSPLAGIDIMLSIAKMTGGQAAINTNSLARAIGDAVEDATATYTLGFSPSGDPDGRLHELKVRVSRRDVKVRHRKGYYGFDRRPAQDYRPNSVELLASPLNATSLGLVASAPQVGAEPGAYALTALVDANDLDLRLENGRWVGALLLTMQFQPIGRNEGLLFPTLLLPIDMSDEQFQATLQSGYVLERLIETQGDPGRLRVIVQDVNGEKAGSVWVPIGLE